MEDSHCVTATCSDGRARDDAAPATTPFLQSVIDQLQKPYPDNSIINIVCHGHSVPAGYFRTPEVRSLESYPHLLHVVLKKCYPYAVINVIVTAVGGEDSERGAARFDQDVLSLRPAVITIDYAINDRRIGLQRAESAWRKMIESAARSGVLVVLLTPSPDLEAANEDPANSVQQHAMQIRKLAQEYRIGLADSESAFRAYAEQGGQVHELMAHFRHPNHAGHQLIADTLLPCFVAERVS